VKLPWKEKVGEKEYKISVENVTLGPFELKDGTA